MGLLRELGWLIIEVLACVLGTGEIEGGGSFGWVCGLGCLGRFLLLLLC